MGYKGRKGQISPLLRPSETNSPFLQELGITEEQELVLVRVCVGYRSERECTCQVMTPMCEELTLIFNPPPPSF